MDRPILNIHTYTQRRRTLDGFNLLQLFFPTNEKGKFLCNTYQHYYYDKKIKYIAYYSVNSLIHIIIQYKHNIWKIFGTSRAYVLPISYMVLMRRKGGFYALSRFYQQFRFCQLSSVFCVTIITKYKLTKSKFTLFYQLCPAPKKLKYKIKTRMYLIFIGTFKQWFLNEFEFNWVYWLLVQRLRSICILLKETNC